MRMIKLCFAAVMCLGLVAACSDRMGTMKARKYTQEDYLKSRNMTVEQYNEWARANNKPLIPVRPGPPSNSMQPGVTPNLQPTTPNPLPNSSLRPAPGLSAGPAVTPQPGPSAAPQPGPGPNAGPTPAPAPGPGANPASCGNPPATDAAYPKEFWSCEFRRLMLQQNEEVSQSLKHLIKGITVTSGLNRNNRAETQFTVQAVIQLEDGIRLLETESQAVKFEAAAVAKIPFQLRKSAGGELDMSAAADDIFVSATCLSNDSGACTEFGVIIDFKVPDGRLLAVFQVRTGAGVSTNPDANGIAAGNMAADMKTVLSFVKAQPTAEPNPGAGTSGGPAAPTQVPSTVTPEAPAGTTQFTSAPDALRAAQAMTSKIAEESAKALAAKNAAAAASVAGANCNKDKAAAEADKAEASVKVIEETMPGLQSIVDQLKALLQTQREKDAADRLVSDSRTLLNSAKAAAAEAREAANRAEQTCVAVAPAVSGGPKGKPDASQDDAGLTGGGFNAAPAISGGRPRPVNGADADPEGAADVMNQEAAARARQQMAVDGEEDR